MTINQIGMAFNAFIDDDTLASATSTNVASAESIKAYVDDVASAIPAPGADGTIIIASSSAWITSTSTFANTYSGNALLYASSSNTVTGLAAVNNSVLTTGSGGVPTWAALGDGQLIIGSGSGAPIAATLTAGTNISITNGANSITINSTATSLAWTTDATGSITIAVNNGYVCGNATLTTAALPATAPLGSVVAIEGLGAGGWALAANTGQTIQVGTASSTSGGTVTSAAATDNIYLVCIVANTIWRMTSTNSSGLTLA